MADVRQELAVLVVHRLPVRAMHLRVIEVVARVLVRKLLRGAGVFAAGVLQCPVRRFEIGQPQDGAGLSDNSCQRNTARRIKKVIETAGAWHVFELAAACDQLQYVQIFPVQASGQKLIALISWRAWEFLGLIIDCLGESQICQCVSLA